MKDDVTLIADFSLEDFVKVPTFPHPTQKSIMPVVAFKGEQMTPLGTCFAISNHGLVLTARHVVEDVIQFGAESNDWQVGAVYISDPTLDDDVPDLLGGPIPVNKVHTSNEFDIAVMHLNLPVRKNTGAFLSMPALQLSPAIPSEGGICFTLGYHDTKIVSKKDNAYHKTITQNYSASKGVIEELHFPRRDNSNLNFPCFRTSLRHERGMSGAPVLSEKGAAIGVVCSAIEGEEIYYVSLIGLALFLQIDAIDVDNNYTKMFLYDFITSGVVGTDDTINKLNINRQGNDLEISFDNPPVYRGSLNA